MGLPVAIAHAKAVQVLHEMCAFKPQSTLQKTYIYLFATNCISSISASKPLFLSRIPVTYHCQKSIEYFVIALLLLVD